MTRRDWWLGIVVLAFAIVLHAAVPRYEWRTIRGVPMLRVDRWTGTAVLGTFAGGHWTPRADALPPSLGADEK